MLLHRIGSKQFADTRQGAFGGQGSLGGDGRWHHRGRLIVYTATHRSLALLEILTHLDRRNQLQPQVAWEIDLPDQFILEPRDLPADWLINLEATRTYGDSWLASRASVGLRLPSAIVPSEMIVLINPAHPDFDMKWVSSGPTPVPIDPRLI